MKVKELIEELQQYNNPNAEVITNGEFPIIYKVEESYDEEVLIIYLSKKGKRSDTLPFCSVTKRS